MTLPIPTFESLADRLEKLDKMDSVSVGNLDFGVLFTPGHAPGHVCFYNAHQQFMFGGDLLFQGGIGRTDLPLCNPEHMNNSLKAIFHQLGDEVVVFPGHGDRTSIGQERRFNFFVKSLLQQ